MIREHIHTIKISWGMCFLAISFQKQLEKEQFRREKQATLDTFYLFPTTNFCIVPHQELFLLHTPRRTVISLTVQNSKSRS